MHRVAATGLYLAITLLAVGGPHADSAVSEAADPTVPTFELATFGGEAYSDKSLQGQPTLRCFGLPGATSANENSRCLNNSIENPSPRNCVCFPSVLLTRERMSKRL